MLGLFGTLNLAANSLSTQRQGTEVAGHNLANINTDGYSRQRLKIETSISLPTVGGQQGTGAVGVAIERLRDDLIDRQILSEGSVLGSLESRQRALEYAQSNLGQRIDRQASGAEGAAAAGAGGQSGLAEQLDALFNAFQSVSTDPTSTAERQALLLKAQDVAAQFNQVAARFDDLHGLLDRSIEAETLEANTLLEDVASLNRQILAVEVGGTVANDLRDLRQHRLEALSKLTQLTATELPTGAVNVTIAGTAMVSGSDVVDRLEAYDPGTGVQVRAQSTGTPLVLGGGSIQGTIDARDTTLAGLRADFDRLAANLVGEVNAIHADGFGLAGTSGNDFFVGGSAATIRVNRDLLDDPSRIQASAAADTPGNNDVVLRLARLAQTPLAALGNQTIAAHYSRTVTGLGSALASVNSQIQNENIVSAMLHRQRDSVSGVSLDEEMTDLIRFQKAFEASARLVSTVDEMLDIVLNLKR